MKTHRPSQNTFKALNARIQANAWEKSYRDANPNIRIAVKLGDELTYAYSAIETRMQWVESALASARREIDSYGSANSCGILQNTAELETLNGQVAAQLDVLCELCLQLGLLVECDGRAVLAPAI
jgi:hypothetical protein